jgi:hypothetical protein
MLVCYKAVHERGVGGYTLNVPHGAGSGGGFNVTVAVAVFVSYFPKNCRQNLLSLYVKIAATGMKKQE